MYIPSYSVDFTREEKIRFVMVRPAITVYKYFKKFGFALTFSKKFLHYMCY